MVFFVNGPASALSDWSEFALPQTQPGSVIDYKIMLIGDDSSGKTSLVDRFGKKSFTGNSDITIGVDYSKFKLYTADQIFRLHLWDTSGQERFKGIISPYYARKDAIIVCFSFDDPSSFQHLPYWLDKITPDDNGRYPGIILAGTKSDLREQQVSDEQITDLMTRWNNEHPDMSIDGYIETSAKTGMNVELLFKKTAQTCWLRQQTKTTMPVEQAVTIKNEIAGRIARYIAETDRKRDAQGSFAGDFSLFAAARAHNREIDYQIARQLQDELNGTDDLRSIFHPLHLDRLRQQAVSRHAGLRQGNPGFFSLPHDISRGRLGVIWNDSVDLITHTMAAAP